MTLITHFIDFFFAFFTNLNPKKIAGAVLALIGVALIGRMSRSADANIAVLYAVAGLFIGGAGLAIIYHDIAKDQNSHKNDEVPTLVEGFKQKELADRESSAWHMNDEPKP